VVDAEDASSLFPRDVVTVEEKLASSFSAAASSLRVFKVDGAESTIAATAAADAELKSILFNSVFVAYVEDAEIWVRYILEAFDCVKYIEEAELIVK